MGKRIIFGGILLLFLYPWFQPRLHKQTAADLETGARLLGDLDKVRQGIEAARVQLAPVQQQRHAEAQQARAQRSANRPPAR
jgi:hypothetical protein